MATRIRERIGALESSLTVFAHNWRQRIRSSTATGEASSPSSPVSTTTNLDTLEVTVVPVDVHDQSSDSGVILESQESVQSSPDAAPSELVVDSCQASQSTNLAARHSNSATLGAPTSAPPRRSRRSHRSSRHGSYRIGIQDLDDDRNMLAAVISLFVILILASALAQFRWFSIFNETSLCDFGVHLRTEDEFKLLNVLDNNSSSDDPPNSFDSDTYIRQPYSNSLYSTPQPPHQKQSSSSQTTTTFVQTPQSSSSSSPDTIELCDNPEIASMKRSIIILCFIAIKVTLMQFFLDIFGTRGYYSKRVFSVLRSHGVGNIITVIVCVLIIAICYYMGLLTERLQMDYIMKKFRYTITKSSSSGGQIPSFPRMYAIRQVKFEVSYYLVTLAGFFSILGAAANLFRKPKYVLMERIGSHTRTRRIGGGDQATLLNLDSSTFYPYFQPGIGWVNYPSPAVAPQTPEHPARNDAYLGYARPDPYACPPPPPYTP